ncbi:MAG: hypothetical protein M3Z31_13875, partial [Pseudomonadota bacterium]|nr:hypothetical protein [Pseudomonadota bacterium]
LWSSWLYEEKDMAAVVRYTKTSKGQEEIAQRQNNLRGKMRTMLILVDPAKSREALLDQGQQIGVPADFLDTLVREGYVRALSDGPEPGAIDGIPQSGDAVDTFRSAKAFMNDSIVNALGFRAFMFTLRLERCASRSDLADLMPDYVKSLRKASSDAEANALAARMRELLT